MKIIIEVNGGIVTGVYYAGATRQEHLPIVFVVDRDVEQIGEPAKPQQRHIIPLRQASKLTRDLIARVR